MQTARVRADMEINFLVCIITSPQFRILVLQKPGSMTPRVAEPYSVDWAGAAFVAALATDSLYPRRYPAANMERSWSADHLPMARRGAWPLSAASLPR